MEINRMNFRDKAVKLYNQGKSIEEIQEEIGIPLQKSTIENWKKENERFGPTAKLINESVKIKKTLKNKNKITPEQEKELNEQLKNLLIKILENDPENTIAERDLFKVYFDLKIREKAKEIGEKILQKNSNDIFVLNKLANIGFSQKQYDVAKKYLERIVELQPDKEQFKAKLEEAKFLEKQQKEQEEKKTMNILYSKRKKLTLTYQVESCKIL